MHVIDDFSYYTVVDNADEIIEQDSSYDTENRMMYLDDLGWV